MAERRRFGIGYGCITKAPLNPTATTNMDAADVAGTAFFFDEELAGGASWTPMHVAFPIDIGDVTSATGGNNSDRDC